MLTHFECFSSRNQIPARASGSRAIKQRDNKIRIAFCCFYQWVFAGGMNRLFLLKSKQLFSHSFLQQVKFRGISNLSKNHVHFAVVPYVDNQLIYNKIRVSCLI